MVVFKMQIRYVLRNGEKILQIATFSNATCTVWRDVDVVEDLYAETYEALGDTFTRVPSHPPKDLVNKGDNDNE